MNQLWGVGNLRDYWARWSPAAINNLGWLNAVDCFRPKFYAAPIESLMNVAPSGYLITTFAFVPGSWVVGLSQVNADSLDMQLTDLQANYKFFSAPVSCQLIDTSGGFSGPFWLPEPYMLAGVATLKVEIWNNTALATANSQLLVHVLEPREV
jgi:hypothetical protein